LGASLGPDFADRRYHAYFYDVAPAYIRAGRPSYSAVSGYSGSSMYLTATRRFAHYWIGAFIRYDNLAGASFVRSPLVETQQYLAVGVGLSWIFASSSHLVESGER
jgi:outer membrane scaffolding protein for murein synthesis (MipA/OmpV family)